MVWRGETMKAVTGDDIEPAEYARVIFPAGQRGSHRRAIIVQDFRDNRELDAVVTKLAGDSKGFTAVFLDKVHPVDPEGNPATLEKRTEWTEDVCDLVNRDTNRLDWYKNTAYLRNCFGFGLSDYVVLFPDILDDDLVGQRVMVETDLRHDEGKRTCSDGFEERHQQLFNRVLITDEDGETHVGEDPMYETDWSYIVLNRSSVEGVIHTIQDGKTNIRKPVTRAVLNTPEGHKDVELKIPVAMWREKGFGSARGHKVRIDTETFDSFYKRCYDGTLTDVSITDLETGKVHSFQVSESYTVGHNRVITPEDHYMGERELGSHWDVYVGE
jgi:hypothetical protein